LTSELKAEVEALLERIETLLREPVPPQAKKIPFCRSCAYLEFCWS
jgi:CRISPR-associated exonuclease Cas4